MRREAPSANVGGCECRREPPSLALAFTSDHAARAAEVHSACPRIVAIGHWNHGQFHFSLRRLTGEIASLSVGLDSCHQLSCNKLGGLAFFKSGNMLSCEVEQAYR